MMVNLRTKSSGTHANHAGRNSKHESVSCHERDLDLLVPWSLDVSANASTTRVVSIWIAGMKIRKVPSTLEEGSHDGNYDAMS